ncbi:heparan-alpha-glucosaminide N-acetyltransferase [Aestuariivita sp.]|uniref:heparan-alpha-glucosaminide N-acetyltransferase n=1 Tax=Aestuariivita sp. TaxID=1872407 RepID=UPI003BB0D00E
MSGADYHSDRLLLPDIARSVALCAMIVFHLVRDLEVFGILARGTTLNDGWTIFARSIAASFLFLSGVSLVLAHSRGFRTGAWARRVIVIAGAACLVSLATYIAMPSNFVFFGILHAIAVASVLGVPFLFTAAWVPMLCAAAILLAFITSARSVFQSGWLAWTGLGMEVRPSMDFIPMVPWLAPFLLGIAVAKFAPPVRLEPRWPQCFPVQALAWPGRHSLAVYLVHQPVLLALVWATAQVT